MVIAGHAVVRGLSRFDSDAGVMPVKLGSPTRLAAARAHDAHDRRWCIAIKNNGRRYDTIGAAPCNNGWAPPCGEGRPTRFWNLTRHTISELYLAPAGTTDFGPNQCKNDKDGTIDPDERLPITGVPPGTYDAKLKDVSGRSCLVRNIKLEAGQIFSIEEKELTSCTR